MTNNENNAGGLPLGFAIDRRDTALLVVDIQNGFCHKDSGMARAGIDTTRQQAVVPNIVRVVRLCRAAGLPILASRQVHFHDDVTRRTHRIPSHMDKRNYFPCLRGTWDAGLVSEFQAELRPEDHVFEKHRPSCFFDTTLDTKLRMLGIRMLVITGVATNYCVESTIRDAYFRDYDIVVPSDCVASTFPDLQAATLKNVEIYFGRVTDCDGIERALHAAAL
jgi:ureidoacrylate peracid hydrolase